MSTRIDSEQALTACIGKTPTAIQMKVIDHLDAGAMRWLQASSVAFCAYAVGQRPAITITGDNPGFADALSAHQLRIPCAAWDTLTGLRPGAGFGSLFLIPGLDETLRINGRVRTMDDQQVLIDVEECYVHCAKALIRSRFWSTDAAAANLTEIQAFANGSRFMALASMNAQGQVDVSPKGDPSHALLHCDGKTLRYPERPGNRRADSLHNILQQPQVSAIALIPGGSTYLSFQGSATIHTDITWREHFVVRDRTPKLVTCISADDLSLQNSQALTRAGLWPPAAAPHDIDPAAMFTDHLKLTKKAGLGAGLVRTLSNRRMTKQGLKFDYKHNLY